MELAEDKDEGGFVVFIRSARLYYLGESIESAAVNALDAKKAWLEAYYQNKNYYTDKSNYLNHNIDMYFEQEVCNTCEFIFTSDISVYNAKKIIERRDNIYLIDENIGNEFTIDYILQNIGKDYERGFEDKLREYSKNLDDIYIKSLYLIAAESNNLNNSINKGR